MSDTDPLQRHNGHVALDFSSQGNGLVSLNGHRPVLVLNQNYEPLHVATVRRALVLWLSGKAEILETYEHEVASAQRCFPAPSVIRLLSLVKRPPVRVKLCRREVFLRDNYTCQYCGVRTHDLTIDHVVPRSRGGPHTWENVVSACRTCNHRKGGKSLAEARMQLLRQPFEPRPGRYYLVQRVLRSPVHESWLKFLPDLDVKGQRSR
ncbi:HNH endonuclease [Thermomicrobium sp. CFH 73360]|uniref:HNH endonuclease n=1 Tax=Thermomicrobium sp. CFH 73360 TaxID=2951987 RepID=UPI002077187C|nr:HNH endonuclease [Thermomicrobium sp. CFH 73360]